MEVRIGKTVVGPRRLLQTQNHSLAAGLPFSVGFWGPLEIAHEFGDFMTHETLKPASRSSIQYKQRCIRHLWVVSGTKPTQLKKSLRKMFSSMPTKPVAGEALNLYLPQGRMGKRLKGAQRKAPTLFEKKGRDSLSSRSVRSFSSLDCPHHDFRCFEKATIHGSS